MNFYWYHVSISILYILAGIFLLLTNEAFSTFVSHQVKLLLGGLLLMYGVFRLYRTIKSK